MPFQSPKVAAYSACGKVGEAFLIERPRRSDSYDETRYGWMEKTPKVRTGLMEVLSGARPELRKAKLGLIVHPASVTPEVTASMDALHASGLNLVALFGPQHGARGEKQDNMIESDDFRDSRLDVPVHSLYSDHRKPTQQMLEGLDALVYDLQDVGVRVYTFVWTMTLAMEACKEAGIKFVVLDRPNPLGGMVREGAILEPGFESFVGLHRIPLRHGLTAGELAKLANEEFGIGCDLDVVSCRNLERSDWFDDTGLPYVLPSPNLPTMDSCVVYPGMVLLEGTMLSEGRGTARPFEIFGAPYIDPYEMVSKLEKFELPGVKFRPCYFEPTFNKHQEKLCGGAQLHVTDREAFRSVRAAAAVIATIHDMAPDDFEWRPPPYEYEYEKMPIDILWGNDGLRLGIEAGKDALEIVADAEKALPHFEELAKPYLLY